MSSWAKKAVSTAMVAASISSAAASSAAVDVFIKIGDIKGESADLKHKDEIDVLSWSWGTVGGTSTAASAAPGAHERISLTSLTITKRIDASSANLIKAALSGKHMADATLAFRKPGTKDAGQFLTIKLKDVFVSVVKESGSSTDLPTEDVTLNFTSFDFAYATQRPDGTLVPTTPTSWNTATGVSG
jgi:type VI secretion system secreted protein Hcp